jgi:hypothetical protein
MTVKPTTPVKMLELPNCKNAINDNNPKIIIKNVILNIVKNL